MTTTADLLALRQKLRSENNSATGTRTGFSADHIYSRSGAAIYPAILSDINDNGFEVRCIRTGAVFTIKPNGSICHGLIKSLEREWFGTSS
nr:MAG TPA: hypothetical protein [Caudoviricetes sp.]